MANQIGEPPFNLSELGFGRRIQRSTGSFEDGGTAFQARVRLYLKTGRRSDSRQMLLENGRVIGVNADPMHFPGIQFIQGSLHQTEHRARIDGQLAMQNATRDGQRQFDGIFLCLMPALLPKPRDLLDSVGQLLQHGVRLTLELLPGSGISLLTPLLKRGLGTLLPLLLQSANATFQLDCPAAVWWASCLEWMSNRRKSLDLSWRRLPDRLPL